MSSPSYKQRVQIQPLIVRRPRLPTTLNMALNSQSDIVHKLCIS